MLDRKLIVLTYFFLDAIILILLGALFSYSFSFGTSDLIIYLVIGILILILLFTNGVYSLIIRDNWSELIFKIGKIYLFFLFSYLAAASCYFLIFNTYIFSANIIFYISLACFFFIVSRSFINSAGEIAFNNSIGLKNRKRVLVIGSGEQASFLARGLISSDKYKVSAFVTDDSRLVGSFKYGVEIKSISDISNWGANNLIDIIWVTSEFNLEDNLVSRIREKFRGIPIKSFDKLNFEDSQSDHIHDEKKFNLDKFLLSASRVSGTKDHHEYLSGSSILVTGAGGSIGSSIVKEVLRSGPKKLILLDNSEFSMYQLQESLESEALDIKLMEGIANCSIKYIMGDIKNLENLKLIFNEHSIDYVFHAAAYKHVPLVESNKIPAFENNVIGTFNLVICAVEFQIKRFVLISSDKAVRPTNFMGVTKRIAELIVTSLNKPQLSKTTPSNTVFAAVRFGNVIGSSGSVLPKFLSQIRSGGPVTVTHKKVERFFMSINEASKLVITAGGISSGGEIFLLDMGKSVNIYDLAKHLIRAHGLKVKSEAESDGIAINVIGLRPGEKLFEELLIQGDSKLSKAKGIYYADEPVMDWVELKRLISLYRPALTLKEQSDIIKECSNYVHGYSSNDDIKD